MLKIFSAVVLATFIYSGAADAHGGGPVETMPGTNYTDMPDYRPRSVTPHVGTKHIRKHVRQGSIRND